LALTKNAIRRSFALSAALLAGLFSVAVATPAHADADYTIDCNQTQGPPYEDTDPRPEIWYSSYVENFGGTEEQTVTVHILNCEFHSVRDDPSGWIFQAYVGTDANEQYTVTIPVRGTAEVGGYNTSPAETSFTIRFWNEAPSSGGEDDTEPLAQTGTTDATNALLAGGLVGAVGLALSVVRRRHARI
jgi:LPXTG-motif cell wall-anchored protein